jgi:hypothetical protein
MRAFGADPGIGIALVKILNEKLHESQLIWVRVHEFVVKDRVAFNALVDLQTDCRAVFFTQQILE